MPTLFSTDAVDESKRFDFWKNRLGHTHVPAEFQRLSRRPFSGVAETALVGKVRFSRVHSIDQKMLWTPVRMPQSGEGALLVSLQTMGKGILLQDGREAVLDPGSIVFCESIRPFSWTFKGDFEQLVLRLPREALIGRFGHLEQLTARPISGSSGLGSLVSTFLRQTFPLVGVCSPSTAYQLSQMSLELAATALGELTGHEELHSWGRVALLRRAKQVIEENLNDPELSPAKVANLLRISVRYLQDLFQEENITTSKWIWRQRLERARHMLGDPFLGNVSISKIAFDCGFSDCSHFNHRFRAAFGSAPTEYRSAQQDERRAIKDLGTPTLR